MRHLKSFSACAAICGWALVLAAPATPALAADWTEGYFGATLGSRTLEANWTTTNTYDPFGPMATTSDATESVTSNDNNLGFFAGYNWSLDEALVAGVEADILLMENMARIDRIPGLGNPAFPPSSFVEIRAEDSVSLRGRGGYRLRPELLVYGTTGLARLNVAIQSTCPGDIGVCNPFQGSQSFANAKKMRGATIGVGVEYARGASLYRAEYRRTTYDDFSFTAIPVSDSIFAADAVLDMESSLFQIGVVSDF